MAFTVYRSKVSHGMRIAAEIYRKSADDVSGLPGHDRLAAQFREQAQEAEIIAESIENGCNLKFMD